MRLWFANVEPDGRQTAIKPFLMKRKLVHPLLLFTTLCLLCSAKSYALSVMLDFGPTLVQAADATNAPGHAVGAIPLNQITWNRITGDSNVLYYSDGTI